MEVVKLPGIGDEVEILAGPQQPVGQVDGLEVMHVDVRCPVEHQERTLDAFHAVGGGRQVMAGGVLLGSPHAPHRPTPSVVAELPGTGDVHPGGKERRVERQRLHRHEPAVAESPDADAVRIHELQALQVVGRRGVVLVVPSPDVAVDPLPEIAAVADASAIVGHEHDVPLRNEELVERVVHPVIAPEVPAVVVLGDPVAVDPDDGGMPDGTVKPLGDEEIAGNLAPVPGWKADELALGEKRRVERLGKRVCKPHRFTGAAGVHHKEIRRGARARVLIHDAAAVGREATVFGR